MSSKSCAYSDGYSNAISCDSDSFKVLNPFPFGSQECTDWYQGYTDGIRELLDKELSKEIFI